MRSSGIIFILLVTFIFINELIAQSPTISIQSTLKTIAGDAVPDGNQSMTFRLYPSETGGTAVWTETATVEVTGGIYSHELGSVTALQFADFAQQLYLEVVVNGNPLSPRTKLGHSPFSFRSNTSELLIDGNSSNYAEMDDTYDVFHASKGGRFMENLAVSAGNILPQYTITMGDDDTGIDAPVADKISIMTGGQENAAFRFINNERVAFLLGKTSFGFSSNPLLTMSIGDNNTGINWEGPDSLSIRTNGSKRITVTPNGRVGIGTDAPKCMLDVSPSTNTWVSGSSSGTSTWTTPFLSTLQHGTNFGSSTILAYFTGSVVSTQGLVASTGFTFSDKRIKINFKKSNNKDDLDLINKIEITEYDHIDKKSQDNRTQKKVIAQQVQSIYPNAVSTMRKVIPNVYQLASSIDYKDQILTITTDKKHDFIKGDKIDIYTSSSDMNEVEVLDIIDENTFTIAATEKPESAFVYGKYVDDFLVVDYDAISMLNVSATQELYKRLVALEQENQSLRAENSQIKQSYDVLDGRLAKLEKLLSADNTNGLTQANEE